MKITNVRVMLLGNIIPVEKRWTSDLGTNVKQSAAIVEVETDEGIRGYGEAKGDPIAMKTIVEKHFRPMLIGEDPTRVSFLWEKMYNGSRLRLAIENARTMPAHGYRGENICAISGIDVALWDIAGKAAGVPIYKLFGGPVRDRIRGYGSGGWAPPELIGEQLAGYAAKGFRAVKMRVGGLDGMNIARTVARVDAARNTLGPGIEIMLDSHGSCGKTLAIRTAKALECYDINWFEEPTTGDDLDGLAEVRASTFIPIAAGENETTRFAFKDYLDHKCLDIWQPDIAIAGGLTETVRIANLASAWNIPLAPHVWGTALLWAASLQLAAIIANYYLFEFCQAYNPLLYDLIDVPVKCAPDGFVEILGGPGLGINIDPEAEKRYPFPE